MQRIVVDCAVAVVLFMILISPTCSAWYSKARFARRGWACGRLFLRLWWYNLVGCFLLGCFISVSIHMFFGLVHSFMIIAGIDMYGKLTTPSKHSTPQHVLAYISHPDWCRSGSPPSFFHSTAWTSQLQTNFGHSFPKTSSPGGHSKYFIYLQFIFSDQFGFQCGFQFLRFPRMLCSLCTCINLPFSSRWGGGGYVYKVTPVPSDTVSDTVFEYLNIWYQMITIPSASLTSHVWRFAPLSIREHPLTKAFLIGCKPMCSQIGLTHSNE